MSEFVSCFLFNYIEESTQDSVVYPVLLCNVIRVSYAVRRPCSDFMDMLRRPTSCRIIIIIIIIIYYMSQAYQRHVVAEARPGVHMQYRPAKELGKYREAKKVSRRTVM